MKLVCIKVGEWYLPNGKLDGGPELGEIVTVLRTVVNIEGEIYYRLVGYGHLGIYWSDRFIETGEAESMKELQTEKASVN